MENSFLLCPVCGQSLNKNEKSFSCPNGHSFDRAKEGYVNLLLSGKSGGLIGDNRDMAKSRRDFLNKGYFSVLADSLCREIASYKKESPAVLDICCGEGYYSEQVLEKVSCRLFGFDISKEMVRLAAKRRLPAEFFVANLSHIPLADESTDVAFHLFAPFHDEEFSRILKKDGRLITVVPGENHLFSLKAAVYGTPYKNDEKLPDTKNLRLIKKEKAKAKIRLESNDDINSLFKMTPYFYRTSKDDLKKLDSLSTLETEIEFVLGVYEKA